MFKEMSEEDWIKEFRTIKNHIDTRATFDGEMFETYGEELEFVKSYDPACVWTYGDGDDGGTYIWNGYRIVNRIGYFITEVPCPENEEIQICIFEGDDEDELDTIRSI